NVKIERTLSSGDIMHSLVINYVYQVPTPFINSALSRQVLGGWQISGIWRGQTGAPLFITQTGGRPDILDLKAAVNAECCSFGNTQYLNPAAFQLQPVITASGRTPRRGYASGTPVRGPGINNLDLSLGKAFSLAEKKNLELKVDMLNALNGTQYTSIV